MIKVFIDILIYNYTPFKSFFFLLNINNRSLLYNIVVGLFIDIFITHTFLLNTIFIVLGYLVHKYLKLNYYNILNYYLFSMSLVFSYYLFFSLIYQSSASFLNVFVINSFLVLISYISYEK